MSKFALIDKFSRTETRQLHVKLERLAGQEVTRLLRKYGSKTKLELQSTNSFGRHEGKLREGFNNTNVIRGWDLKLKLGLIWLSNPQFDSVRSV